MASPATIGGIIAQSNGQAWLRRYLFVRANHKVCSLKLCASDATDLVGVTNYAAKVIENGKSEESCNTFYEIVNQWQVHYARAFCDTNGVLKNMDAICYSDEAMFDELYATRPKGLVVLDVGCNTGLNLRRAMKYTSDAGTVYQSDRAFGVEYSADSASIAKGVFGDEAIVQGDSAGDFIVQKKWEGKFDMAHFTAVAQHLTPGNLQKTLQNIALGLKAPAAGQTGGELLMTFKDAPTKEQLKAFGMDMLANQIFKLDNALADPQADSDGGSSGESTDSTKKENAPKKTKNVMHGTKESYLSQGFITAVMWDDDYYPGVVGSSQTEVFRDPKLPGSHKREFNFYSLEFIKTLALKCGLEAKSVMMHLDSKIPFSAAHWCVIFEKVEQ